ncbi:MAG TPA: hypothetical protein VMS76_16130 [Planctomycetota bacterium]|nr:hypothetical protein [Planctomycetota bacterium]
MNPIRFSFLLLLLASAASADQVIVPASKDNTLYQSSTGSLSNGAGPNFFAGRDGSGAIKRAVVAFDVAAHVPAGSRIDAARLVLTLSATIVGPKNVGLHALLADWGEGTSVAGFGGGGGAAATPGDATWLHTFHPSQFWAAPGGDFAPSASASILVNLQLGAYTWGPTPAMTADVQAWLDNPSLSFGWCLVGDESTAATAKRFDSREHPTPAVRPQLVVDFTPPPQAYCTAKVNSLGCTPAIGWSGFPSATAGSGFAIAASSELAQKFGLLFYGTSGPQAQPFQGGFLCAQGPIQRTAVQASGGAAGSCSGSYSFDFNVWIAGGSDPALVAGAQAWAQYWSRDPASPSTTNLTDALEFTIAP